MGRPPCCVDETGLKKGPWTPEEDEILVNYINHHGHGSWRALPKLAGLNRCGKSCRLRWMNYLRPDIKRGKFAPEEENTIINLHRVLGNKWSAIAAHLPGRTDNEIKNYWNTHLKKKLISSGIDPVTHRPRTDIFSSLPQLLALAKLKELIDNLSLEEHALMVQAEAMAKLQYLQHSLFQAPPTPSIANPNPNPLIYYDQNLTGLLDTETMKLLSSLPPLLEASGTPTATFPPLSLEDNSAFSFPRLPDLQNPSSFELTTLGKVPEPAGFSGSEDSPNFTSWQPSTSPKPSSHHHHHQHSINNDAVSCSSWPDILLDDLPLSHDLLS